MKCLLLAILILQTFIVAQADSNYIFKNLNTENGLAHNDSYGVVEDATGHIWIGGLSGLQKYNGYYFKNFRKRNNTNDEIAENRIRNLRYNDTAFDLWIESEGGIYVFDLATESYIDFSFENENSAPVDNLNLNLHSVYKNIVVVSNRDGIYYGVIDYDNKTIRLHPVKNLPEIKRGYLESSQGVTSKDGNIFIIYGNALLHLYIDNGKVSFVSDFPELNRLGIYSIDLTEENALWVGGFRFVSSFYFQKTADDKPWTFLKNKKFNIDSSFSLNTVTAIKVSKDQSLWLGSRGSFIKIENIGQPEEHIYAFKASRYDPKGLPSSWASSFCLDSSNRLWISSFRNGISILNLDGIPFYSIKNEPDNENSLNDPFTLCVYEHDDGTIWIGTETGGINIYDPETNKFRVLNRENSGLNSNTIKNISKLPDNKLLISTGIGVAEYNFKTDRVEKIYGVGDQMQRQWYSRHAVDKFDRIWAILSKVGVSIFELNGESNMPVDILSDHDTSTVKLSSSNVNFICYDSLANEMLLSTDNGINRIFLSKDGDIVRNIIYKADTANHNSLSSNYVWPIAKESDSTYWVGTLGNGLNKVTFLPGTDQGGFGNYKSVVYGREHGAISEEIKSIIVDEHGDLWIGSKGIMRFNPETERFTNFTKEDGLGGNGFVVSSEHRGESGMFYFGGNHGINYFRPEEVLNNFTKNITLRFSDLKVNNSILQPGEQLDGDIIIDKAIPFIDEISFPYNKKNIVLTFTDFDASSSNRYSFRYKIDGFNDDWNLLGSIKEVSLTGLPPGKYNVIVEAFSGEKTLKNNRIELPIMIVPPFYMTYTFYAILFFFTLGILSFLVYYRLRIMKLRQILLTQAVDEKTEELQNLLESKNLFFSMLAHDLRNPFGNLMALSGFLNEEYAELDDNKRKEIVHSQAVLATNLYDLLENLLNWGRLIIHKKVSMNIQECLVHPIIQSIIELQEINTNNVTIKNHCSPSMSVLADENNLKFILRNIIQNAVKFSNKDSVVEVSSETSGSLGIIQVKDFGKGMGDEIIEGLLYQTDTIIQKGSNNKKGTGIGLPTSIEFIRKMGGEVEIESKPEKGTVIKVLLPTAY